MPVTRRMSIETRQFFTDRLMEMVYLLRDVLNEARDATDRGEIDPESTKLIYFILHEMSQGVTWLAKGNLYHFDNPMNDGEHIPDDLLPDLDFVLNYNPEEIR